MLPLTTLTSEPAAASRIWEWNYSASGISAGGTLTTVDSPDVKGGYLITGIRGTRNGDPITRLETAGTVIPGNAPYIVDDLLFAGPGPQLTGNGFGFCTASGDYTNPFYADFLATPGYLEFFSKPPFSSGTTPNPNDTELPVRFTAAPVLSPEPAR